ncbi:CPBP family intramembrane glutamic endopeptidase [Sphaerisporangium fuscum]|uniref:CPBP family intramembrane glutamic endopeptidase n=1 Tax=Sphaerisporangium fuscum TaxID=2835868 RepID=UPI001BDCF734|nr:type II CAAX endopeptidase family protein [Sphaerisporangium fuscum]
MRDPSQANQPEPDHGARPQPDVAGGGGAPEASPWARPPAPYQPWQAPPAPRYQVVPPPPGLRYDHLARTPVNRWWRPLVGTLIVAGAFVAVSVAVIVGGTIAAALLGIPVIMSSGRMFGNPVFELSVMLLSIAAVLPLVFGTAWLVQRRPPGTLSSVLGRVRWGWLLICLVPAVLALVLGQAAMIATLAVTGQGVGQLFGWVGWDRFLPGMVAILVLVPFQAAAEEYVFRGWVIQAFGAYFRTPWPGILLGAAAFTSLHAYTDWGIIDVFGFGALMGWLAVRTGGLEAPIALHVTNNIVSFLPSAASGDLGNALQQGAVPWQSLAGTVVQLGFFTVAVVIIAQKRAIPTVSR